MAEASVAIPSDVLEAARQAVVPMPEPPASAEISRWILNKSFSPSAEALIAFTDFFFSTDATAWQALLAPFNRQTTTNSL